MGLEEYINKIKTDNKNFKRWFGNSVVVNDDGSPKIVYHGSRSYFTKFEKSSDIGFHFGTKKASDKIIDIGASSKLSPDKFHLDISNMVLPTEEEIILGDYESFMIDIENEYTSEEMGIIHDNLISLSDPFMFDENIGGEEDLKDGILHQMTLESIRLLGGVVFQKGANVGLYFIKIENPFYGEDLHTWTVEDFKDHDFGESLNEDIDKCKTLEDIKNVFISSGFDGYIYPNYIEDDGSDSYIVFHPENIKSIFNKGSFDKNSPNIFESYQKT